MTVVWTRRLWLYQTFISNSWKKYFFWCLWPFNSKRRNTNQHKVPNITAFAKMRMVIFIVLYSQVCMSNTQAFTFFWLLGATDWVGFYVQLQIKHLLCRPGTWQELSIRHKIVRVAIPAKVTGSETLGSRGINSQQNSAKSIISMTEYLARAGGHLKLGRMIPQTGKTHIFYEVTQNCSHH